KQAMGSPIACFSCHFCISQYLLIHRNYRIPIRVGIHPGSLVFLHVDAAVATVACEALITARIDVGELRAETVIDTPPCVMDEVAAPMVKNAIVNGCIGVPEG